MVAPPVDRSPHSLYIHIPFCVSKCPYCDFNSHVGLEHLFESYNRALVEEIRSWGRELKGPRLDTIFIGGGTPSRVPAAHIQAVMDAVRAEFDLAPDAEVTLEANPQSAEAERMATWLAAGVNRLSLGFQSLDANALGFLGRAHDAQEAVSVFGRARAAGFGWRTVRAVMNSRSNLKPSGQTLEAARENFERLTAATALRVVRFWQVRQGTGE